MSQMVYIFLASIILSLSMRSLASETQAPDLALNYADLEAMAKTSVFAEANDLNVLVGQLASQNYKVSIDMNLRGYKKGDLQIFRKFAKPRGIDPRFLYDVCALSGETVTTILSTQITQKCLDVSARLNAVNAVKSSVNGKLFGVMETACLKSRHSFANRLNSITSNGQSINLTPDQKNNIASIVFFPTDFARPRFIKKMEKALPYVLNGALVFGASASIVGLPMSGIWMSVTVASGSSFTLKNMLPSPDEIIQQKRVSDVEVRNGVRIDLSESEKSLSQ